jgi:hypothetical protein
MTGKIRQEGGRRGDRSPEEERTKLAFSPLASPVELVDRPGNLVDRPRGLVDRPRGLVDRPRGMGGEDSPSPGVLSASSDARRDDRQNRHEDRQEPGAGKESRAKARADKSPPVLRGV